MNGDKFIYRDVPFDIIPHVDIFEARVNRQYVTDEHTKRMSFSIYEKDEEKAIERVKQAIDDELDGD